MTKRKHGPRLFELLGDDREQVSATLEVPRWWSGRAKAPKPPPPAPAKERAAPSPLRLAPSPEGTGAASFFEMEGDRIRLSFTSTTAAVALFVTMVMLVATFELGSRSGHRKGLRVGYDRGRESYAAEAIGEIEAARAQPPATHLVGNLLAEPRATPADPAPIQGAAAPTASPAAAPSGWIRGHTYIVAQEFAAERPEDAEKARAFLAEHGIETEPVPLKSGAIQLITRQGFNHADPGQKSIAAQLMEKIRSVGGKYFAGGGGYKLEGYFKALKTDQW